MLFMSRILQKMIRTKSVGKKDSIGIEGLHFHMGAIMSRCQLRQPSTSYGVRLGITTQKERKKALRSLSIHIFSFGLLPQFTLMTVLWTQRVRVPPIMFTAPPLTTDPMMANTSCMLRISRAISFPSFHLEPVRNTPHSISVIPPR